MLNNFKTFKKEDFLSRFSNLYKIAINQIPVYYTIDLVKNEKDWLIHLHKEAHNLRITNPHFLIDIVKNKRNFIKVLKALGTPYMFNSNGKAWFNLPQSFNCHINGSIVTSISEIFSLFEYGKMKCDLINYCGYDENKDITDERCDVPWKRSNDEKLCGYAVYWRAWGLTGLSPTTTSENSRSSKNFGSFFYKKP